jgi:hypothetical protein
MGKRTNNKQNARRSKGSRASGPRSATWTSYQTSRAQTVATLSGTKASEFTLATANLLPEFITTSVPRNCILRRILFRFAPLPQPLIAASNGPLAVQLRYVTVDGIAVIMTKTLWLSVTNETRLGFSMPWNMAEIRTVNDTADLIGFRIFNVLGVSAVVQAVDYTIETTFGMESAPMV